MKDNVFKKNCIDRVLDDNSLDFNSAGGFQKQKRNNKNKGGDQNIPGSEFLRY